MNKRPLIIWLLLAYGLCMLPADCFRWIGSSVERASGANTGGLLEWTAHAVLMAGVAYHLMGANKNRKINDVVMAVLSVASIMVIAVSIEILQGQLPESFSRGFAWSDIWSSLLGGVVGSIVAAVFRFKR